MRRMLSERKKVLVVLEGMGSCSPLGTPLVFRSQRGGQTDPHRAFAGAKIP